MLVPAIIYKDEICKAVMKYKYTDDMIYYTGCLGDSTLMIDNEDDGSLYQYAIIDNDRLIGYFTYAINWYSSCARNFGLFSFDRNNRIVGIDIYRELKKIINDYHIHRIEWRMVGGNPVERHYDKFCNKYHGKKFILIDAIKDRFGKFHDDIIYEIICDRRADNKPIRQSCKSCKHYSPDPNYRDGDMGNCRYLEKIWEKPFYVNEARAECEHFQAAERRNENGNET